MDQRFLTFLQACNCCIEGDEYAIYLQDVFGSNSNPDLLVGKKLSGFLFSLSTSTNPAMKVDMSEYEAMFAAIGGGTQSLWSFGGNLADWK